MLRPILEVHLFDFAADIYGAHLTVRFLHKIRDEMKFSGFDALKAQIARDVETARQYQDALNDLSDLTPRHRKWLTTKHAEPSRHPFLMRGDLAKREPAGSAWQGRSSTSRSAKASKGRPRFVLHDGPRTPTATFTSDTR